MTVSINQIQIRRGTTAEWVASNPVLRSGEMGFDTDLRRTKTGDGTSGWNALEFTGDDYFDPLGSAEAARIAAQAASDPAGSAATAQAASDPVGSAEAARIAAEAASDPVGSAEVARTSAEAASQPLAAVLTNTTASFTTEGETKLDGAAPKASPTFTGDVKIPDANADGEALAYAQDDAVLQGLMVTKSAAPAYTLYELGEAADKGRWRIAVSGSDLYVQQMTDDGGFISSPMIFNRDDATDLSGSSAVTVPVPTTTGQALRWGSPVSVAALEATGNVSFQNFVNFTRVGTAAQFAEGGAVKFTNAAGENVGLILSSSGRLVISSLGDTAFTGPSVTVPVPTTAGQALRWGSNATVAALTATGDVKISSETPNLYIYDTNSAAGTRNFKINVNGNTSFLRAVSDDGLSVVATLAVMDNITGEVAIGAGGSVTVPAPTASGHALRQGSDATVAALTATGNAQVTAASSTGGLTVDGTNPRVKIDATSGGAGMEFYEASNIRFAFAHDAGNDRYVWQQYDDAGAFVRTALRLTEAGVLQLLNTVEVPVPSATGHALRWGSNATVAALTATGNIEVTKTFGKLSAQHTGDGTTVALNTTVGKAFLDVNGGAQLIQLVDDDTVNMAGAISVEVPVPSDNGHALRWGSDTTVAALKATGGIVAEGPFPRVGARTNTPGGNAGFEWFNDTELSWLAYVVDGSDTLRFRRSIGGVLQPNSLALTAAGAVEVPVPSATGHALRQGSNATVAALDATGEVKISAGYPSVLMISSVAPANKKRFLVLNDNGEYVLRSQTDGGATVNSFFRATHAGAITMASATSVTVPVPTEDDHAATRLYVDTTAAAAAAAGPQTYVGAIPPINPAIGSTWLMEPDDHIAMRARSGWKPIWPPTDNNAVATAQAFDNMSGLWVASEGS